MIPPAADSEFVACMEDVLETCKKPCDKRFPVLCMDEQPVQLLKETGGGLVDVHGQFENQRLLNEGAHRGLLDFFGGLSAGLKKTGDAHKVWKDAAGARIRAEAEMATARRDEEFLHHALDEITGLDPKPGEETDLARQRTLMMHGEQLVAAMNTAAEELGGDGGALRSLEAALRELERVAEKADGRLADTLDALVRALAFEPPLAAALGQCPDTPDVGLALGHRNGAPGVQQIEQMTGLQALVICR